MFRLIPFILMAIHCGFCLSIGDYCLLQSGSMGECVLLQECKKAIKDLRVNKKAPLTCGFQGSSPVVCCDIDEVIKASNRSRPVGEVSLQKCREYGKYVYEERLPPIPLLNVQPKVYDECGIVANEYGVGGEEAQPKEFPHMAFIGYEPLPDQVFWRCGAGIISEVYILAPGHCLHLRDFGNAKYVKVGVAKMKSTYLQQIAIAERIPHPMFNADTQYNDVGLIKLHEPIKFNPYVHPACLNSNFRPTAEKAVSSGWGVGITDMGHLSNEVLYKATLEFLLPAECNHRLSAISNSKLRNGISEQSHICTKSLMVENSLCDSDYGGILQVFHNTNNVYCMYDIIGVMSLGKRCEQSIISLGVFTKLESFIDWIENIVWPYENK